MVGDMKQTVAQSGLAFSDGSGGPQWVPKVCRRAGAGAAALDFTCTEGNLLLRSAAWVGAQSLGDRQSRAMRRKPPT